MGDPSEIARLLKAFATSSDVKLIVSSRPWTEIEIFLKPIAGQSLSLQYFTREDIERYTRDLITEHPGFRNAQIDRRYNDLIAQISERSEGVFLWVFLAVREILKGLTHKDTISELEARLENIPPGPNEFFKLILNSIDECYRPQASQILQMCLAASEPLPLFTFSFLEEEQKNPNYAIAEESIPWTTDHMKKELETLKIRVKARCRDFLQISETVQWKASNPGVSFLHRTVKDFFLEPRNQTLLHGWIKFSYNPRLSLCRSFVMQTKVLLDDFFFNSSEPIIFCLIQFRRTEISCDAVLVSALIKELERISAFRSYFYEKGRFRDDNDHFKGGAALVPAVRTGTDDYVRQQLLKTPAMVNNLFWRRPLLHYALFEPAIYPTTFDSPSAAADILISVIRLLLETGADPNWIQTQEQLDGYFGGYRDTIWATFLLKLFQPDNEIIRHNPTRAAIFDAGTEIFKLLLEYGADLSAKITNGGWDHVIEIEPENHYTVSEYLEKLLPRSAECYSLFLEHKRKNESRNMWDGILKRRFISSNILRYISGLGTEVTLLNCVVLNIIIIVLEILQRNFTAN